MRLLPFTQWPARLAAPIDAIADARVPAMLPMILRPISSITEQLVFLPVQQFIQARYVGFSSMTRGQTVHQAATVGTHMHLHAEVLLLALARLLHFWIALPSRILGRRRCGDDGRVHNGARFHQQALGLQQRAHLGEHHLGQLVFLE